MVNIAAACSPAATQKQAEFSFCSAHRCVSTSGIFERISLPAESEATGADALWHTVQAAMARAKAQGVSAPLVVGAIPFDTRQSSCLFIPQQHRFSDHPQDTDVAVRPSSVTPVDIVRTQNIPDAAQFQSAVTSALHRFRQGDISKVVLSRMMEIELAQEIDCAQIVRNLRTQNPTGYHFSLPLPDDGILLGASPELLIRKVGRQIWSNPLAGSVRRHADAQQDEQHRRQLLDSQKDQREHRVVVEDIQQRLHPLCRQLNVPETPSLLATNTMWHLSSAISGELAQDGRSVIQLACLLHPTPAMCGAPMAAARDLIAHLEPHDRGVFSGIVGWSDEQGNGEWAIAIRCGIVRQRQLRVFAGAGIVEGSEPQKEWDEVTGKLGTMLRAFGLQPEGV